VAPPASAQRGSRVTVRSYTTRGGRTVGSYTRRAPGLRARIPRAYARHPRNASTIRSYRAYSIGRARHLRTTPWQRVYRRSSASGLTSRSRHGRFQRNAFARYAFLTSTGYPHGRPGYVVDHIIPLACGGRDAPSNMQWQTVASARAKDRTERRGCK